MKLSLVTAAFVTAAVLTTAFGGVSTAGIGTHGDARVLPVATYEPTKLRPGEYRTRRGFVPLTTFRVGSGWYETRTRRPSGASARLSTVSSSGSPAARSTSRCCRSALRGRCSCSSESPGSSSGARRRLGPGGTRGDLPRQDQGRQRPAARARNGRGPHGRRGPADVPRPRQEDDADPDRARKRRGARGGAGRPSHARVPSPLVIPLAQRRPCSGQRRQSDIGRRPLPAADERAQRVGVRFKTGVNGGRDDLCVPKRVLTKPFSGGSAGVVTERKAA